MPSCLTPASRLIEVASKSDLARILGLQKDAYQSEAQIYNDFSIPPLLQTLKDLEDEYESMVFLKIEREGEIVGSIRAFEQDGICNVGKLVVSPRHQNQGLGTALLLEVESLFPSAEAFELFTGSRSTRNLHLYEKLGYFIVRQQEVSPSLTLVFLRKPNQPETALRTG